MHLPKVDKYVYIKSFFSSWDPRAKIVSLSFLIFSIALLSDHLSAFFGLALSIALLVLSKIPFAFVLKHLRWAIIFVGCLFIVLSLTAGGERIHLLSLDGLKLGTLIAMRALSIFMLMFLIIATTRFHTTLKALSRLKVPNILTQLLIFTYRYIFLFIEEARRMFISAGARLFKKKTNLYTLKITSNLVSMLFIRGFERTQSIYNAMASRGYKGSLKMQDEFRLCFKDILKASLIVILSALLHLSRWTR
jgi:cobalt/nickel transport system permease protein